jgi:hypothetical protein
MGRWKPTEEGQYFPSDGNMLKVEDMDFRYIVEDLLTRDIGPVIEEEEVVPA